MNTNPKRSERYSPSREISVPRMAYHRAEARERVRSAKVYSEGRTHLSDDVKSNRRFLLCAAQ